ncbi:MAG: UDP-N-acetylmuramate dehydrogenase [Sediminibacterium sp.]
MQVQENISLKPFNTFGMDVKARYFAQFNSFDEFATLIEGIPQSYTIPHLILGGGSNVLFTKAFDGWVLNNQITGIRLLKEDANYFYVEAGAGENWHTFVLYCINHGYAGIENLSFIPGSVGAAPIQNIGAYGVELKDVFESLEAYHIHEKKILHFNNTDCCFDYRNSIFKTTYKNQLVILRVCFKLQKVPIYKTSYGAIEQELTKMGIENYTIKSISDAVIKIRTAKLPNPSLIGNAGSFFKNPIISINKFKQITQAFPDIPSFSSTNGTKKIAAGWLIEQAGWKGFRNKDAGCYSNQSLVLVNYGHATGIEILALSQSIIESVEKKFAIQLEPEVNIY